MTAQQIAAWWARWPHWAERGARLWSAAYAAGAAVAALGVPLGYSLAAEGRGAVTESAMAVVFAAAAGLAWAMRRHTGVRGLTWAAWAVAGFCLMSGFGFLFSPALLLNLLSRNQDPVHWGELANQGVATAGAALWTGAALAHRRRRRGTCAYCGGAGRRTAVDRRTRAGYLAVAALVPYFTMKTAWALGSRVGFHGAGTPGMDRRYLNDTGIWLHEHGVDITAVLALVGMALALALTRPWGERLPRLPLLVLGWTGAGALAPFGVFLIVVGALTWAGAFDTGAMESYSPWVVVVAYGGFSLYGVGLGRAVRAFRQRTRRQCAHC
ncbi:hypothetical protein ACZ90_59165 [Streptomyces albus subsp. albus]|nr:hypothetical protein ACZ90_59165 [Streptomyces albus subsp. albus]